MFLVDQILHMHTDMVFHAASETRSDGLDAGFHAVPLFRDDHSGQCLSLEKLASYLVKASETLLNVDADLIDQLVHNPIERTRNEDSIDSV